MHPFMSPKQGNFHKRYSQYVDNLFGGGGARASHNANLTLKCNLTR